MHALAAFLATAAGLPGVRVASGDGLVAPPGCVCTGPCSPEYGFCSMLTSSWNATVCPWAKRVDAVNSYVMCVDPVVFRTLANFSAYPSTGTATQWNLPCLGFLGSPDANTSPCAYPDLTRAYAGAFTQGAFPSTVPVTLRANVFDTAGWPAPVPAAFTPADFAATVAAINSHGMFPHVEFRAGQFNSVAPPLAAVAWASHEFNGGNFTELAELYDFFGVPRGGTPGNDRLSPYIEVFSVPSINSLGYTLRRGNPLGGLVPPSLFMLQSSLVDLGSGWNYVAHELGHAFGLLHTFQGLDTSGLLAATCGACVPADNAWTTGDAIADTPPTGSYYYNYAVYPQPAAYDPVNCTIAFDSSRFCTVLPGGHGNMFNLMSYDEMSCRSNFTALQVARTQCFLEQDMGATVVPRLGPGLVTLRAAAGPGLVVLEWLPPASEVWCNQVAGCVDAYLVQRRAAPAGAWRPPARGARRRVGRYRHQRATCGGRAASARVCRQGAAGHARAVLGPRCGREGDPRQPLFHRCARGLRFLTVDARGLRRSPDARVLPPGGPRPLAPPPQRDAL